jgi:transposase InsO family protein
MSRKGNCRDNACAESFFKTLKRELETLDGRHTEAEIRQSVFMYLEAYYNRVRIQQSLTKPLHSLKSRIPVRTFYSSVERKTPGFWQIDTGGL